MIGIQLNLMDGIRKDFSLAKRGYKKGSLGSNAGLTNILNHHTRNK